MIPSRTIQVRRPGLEYPDGALPRYFVDDDILRSHIAAMLSAVFPEGEDFFVRSVRAYRDKIDDPELTEQVRGFIGQEALHGREHRHFNDELQALGYPTHLVDRCVKDGLGLLARIAPKDHQLAVTAGLEHYTATLAETLLTEPGALDEFRTDEVRTLFSWHALEETEHKSVAFDVFQQVSGKRRIRVGVMHGCHVGFFLGMAAAVTVSIALDGHARRHPVELARSIGRLGSHPFFSRKVIRRLRDYDRGDFHPDDHATDELMRTWREKLAYVGAA